MPARKAAARTRSCLYPPVSSGTRSPRQDPAAQIDAFERADVHTAFTRELTSPVRDPTVAHVPRTCLPRWRLGPAVNTETTAAGGSRTSELGPRRGRVRTCPAGRTLSGLAAAGHPGAERPAHHNVRRTCGSGGSPNVRRTGPGRGDRPTRPESKWTRTTSRPPDLGQGTPVEEPRISVRAALLSRTIMQICYSCPRLRPLTNASLCSPTNAAIRSGRVPGTWRSA